MAEATQGRSRLATAEQNRVMCVDLGEKAAGEEKSYRAKGYGRESARVLWAGLMKETLHLVAIDRSLDHHPFPSKIYEVDTNVLP